MAETRTLPWQWPVMVTPCPHLRAYCHHRERMHLIVPCQICQAMVQAYWPPKEDDEDDDDATHDSD